MAKAQLTNAGLTLLTNAQGGSDTITFTKMALGDGKVVDISVSSLTALVSQKAEMPIVSKKFVKSGTYQIGAYFSNEHITTGFYWRETGIFAKGNDGKEILYCYVNVGDAPDYISVATDIRLEKYIYQTLSVGNSTTINITVNESEMLLTVADIGVAGGVAPLNEDKKIDGEFLPDMNYVPIGADGKIDAVYLPTMDYIPTSEKGQANGVTPLDANGKVPSTHLPSMNYIPTSAKGAVNGVAPLGADGKVPTTNLPEMNYAAKDHNHNNSSGGFQGGTNASEAMGGGAVGSGATVTHGGGAVGLNATSMHGGAVGDKANAQAGGAIGQNASTESGAAVGYDTSSTKGAAVGSGAKAGVGLAGGLYAKTVNASGAAIDAIQLGTGTNPNSKTLQIYNFQLLDALGKIPTDRISEATKKIKVGTYVGTGTYGEKNPNIIQFDFTPKFVIVYRHGDKVPTFMIPSQTGTFYTYANPTTGGLCYCSVDSTNKLTWYAGTQKWRLKTDSSTSYVGAVMETIASADDSIREYYQLNISGTEYVYVALG